MHIAQNSVFMQESIENFSCRSAILSAGHFLHGDLFPHIGASNIESVWFPVGSSRCSAAQTGPGRGTPSAPRGMTVLWEAYTGAERQVNRQSIRRSCHRPPRVLDLRRYGAALSSGMLILR